MGLLSDGGMLGGSQNSTQPGSDFGFNLSTVGQQIGQVQQQQTALADQQAAADARKVTLTGQATREQAGISDQSLASAADTRTKQLAVLDGVNQQLTKAKIAMQLSDSGNPLDRLKLWALQQSDPSYTREGNLNRIQYLQSAADALGGIEVLKQQGYQDQITASKNKLAMALQPDNELLAQMQISIDQGQRKIDAAKTAASDRFALLQTNNQIQDAQLANMDRDQTGQAIQQAMQSPDKTANVGGVQISLAQLQSRSASLDDRDFLQYARKLQMQDAALKTLTSTDVDTLIQQSQAQKGAPVVGPDGTQLSLAQLQARKFDLQNQDFTTQQQQAQSVITAKTMKDYADRKLLATYNPAELNQIVLNGGADPKDPSVKYDLSTVQEVQQQKAAAQQNDLQTKATLAGVGDPSQALADFSNYLDNIKTNAPAGGPLSRLLQTQDQVFKISASMITDKDPATAAMGASMLQGARETVEKGIDVEAKRLSNGDKDKEAALQYQLRGQQIPQDVVATALSNRAAKGQPLTGWLSAPSASAYMNTYMATLNQLRTTQPMLGKNEMQQMAAEAAMQQVMGVASQGMTEQLLANQVQMQDNPLNGLVSPEKLLSLYHDADSQGIKTYQQSTGISDDELNKRVASGSDSNLAAAQAAAFYMSLEKIQTGLGQKYLDWWNSPSRSKYVDSFTSMANSNASKNGFSDLAEKSLVLPTLGDQMSAYAMVLNQGQNNVYATELARQHQAYVMFGGNASSKQAFLLQADKNLTDSERKDAMSLLIAPLLKQASDSNMSPEQTSTFIDSQLRTMKPEDTTARKLLTKIMSNRDKSLSVLDDFANATNTDNRTVWLVNPVAGLIARHIFPQMVLDNATAKYQWFQDWQKGNQGYNTK